MTTLKPHHVLQILICFSVTIIFCFSNGIAGSTLPIFSQEQIDDAMSKPLMAYKQVGSNSATVLESQAFHYLVLVCHCYPRTTDSVKNLVADRVLASFRNMISGGKEPYAGHPLYAWSDGAIAQSLLIIKNTPELWNALTPGEQGCADLLMKALVVASNFAFNDKNNFHTGIGNMGNFGKEYNPNYVQGDLGIMIAAALYFGPKQCNQILTTFSYDNYMNQFKQLNWTNLVNNWSATGATLMELGGSDGFGGSGVGVKVPFIYNGVGLDDLNKLFYVISVAGSPKPMYGRLVSNSGADGKAYIISGQSSPVLGKNGMCYEFESTDSKGQRSDALYSYEGWMNSLATRATMMLMGVWGGPYQKITEAYMDVGTTDLIFKLKAPGYHGFFMGQTRDVSDAPNGEPAGKGYFYNKDIWENYVK